MRYELQKIVFSRELSRRALLGIPPGPSSLRPVAVNVWRNHGFEAIIPLFAPFCELGGWTPDFSLSAYDDTLTFDGWKPADMELLWIDSSRFPLNRDFGAWIEWLRSRLLVLRSMSNAPAVVATWLPEPEQAERLSKALTEIPASYFADLGQVCKEQGLTLLEARTAGISGSPVASRAQPYIAREMACRWFPALLFPPIKAVALDLDNTLHAGVLGEDGVEGVEVTSAHAELQRHVQALRRRGVFIALVSRNEAEDVESLLLRRRDYPLRREDFSAFEVSWDDKGNALGRVAETLRISTDAILYVDDNAGELGSVSMRWPGIRTLHASNDATETLRGIEWWPGLWRWKVEADDAKRVVDLEAGLQREALAREAIDPAAYFRNLQARLTYRANPLEQLTRLADLCVKTNQFNLALRRLNQVQISERLAGSDACVMSVQLSDRLSDSGVVAIIVAVRSEGDLLVEEICISCRAMGRRLESDIILGSLQRMPIFQGCGRVVFSVEHGPRNQPALDWLAQLTGKVPAPGLHVLPSSMITNFMPTEGVETIGG